MATSDYVTKGYVDTMSGGTSWHLYKPAIPAIGDCYIDQHTYRGYIWQGTSWVIFSDIPEKEFKVPTEYQLEKHPALKEAWEEFLVVKKLIGV